MSVHAFSPIPRRVTKNTRMLIIIGLHSGPQDRHWHNDSFSKTTKCCTCFAPDTITPSWSQGWRSMLFWTVGQRQLSSATIKLIWFDVALCTYFASMHCNDSVYSYGNKKRGYYGEFSVYFRDVFPRAFGILCFVSISKKFCFCGFLYFNDLKCLTKACSLPTFHNPKRNNLQYKTAGTLNRCMLFSKL